MLQQKHIIVCPLAKQEKKYRGLLFLLLFLFLTVSPKVFANAVCTGPGSECEGGNATACNPSGANTGKICSWTCSATGAFQGCSCSGSCGKSAPASAPAANNTKPAATATNNSGGGGTATCPASGSEVERGNATACNPNGANTGKTCTYTCSNGKFTCTGCTGTATGAKTTTGTGGGTAAGVNAGGAPPPPACTTGTPYPECENSSQLGCYSQYPGQSVMVYPNSGPSCNMTTCKSTGNTCQGPTTAASCTCAADKKSATCNPGGIVTQCSGGDCTILSDGSFKCTVAIAQPGSSPGTNPADGAPCAVPGNAGATGVCDANYCNPNNPNAGVPNKVPPNICQSGICCVNQVSFGKLTLSLHAHLQGTGTGVNADGTPENANPTQKTVTAELYVLPSQLQPRQPAAIGILTYNAKTGLFENNQFLLGNNIPAGAYKVILHVSKYLDTQVMTTDGLPAIAMSPEYTSKTAPVEMIPGDIAPGSTGDNIIDIQDYNTLVSCMGGKNTMCPDPTVADLNGDGKVDQEDLNLLQSHFGATGASFTVQQFVCTQDPTCAKGNNTLQMCPLQCKIETMPTK